MSAARRKGSSFEQAVADFLAQNGFPHAERRVSNGVNDRGDISGVLGTVLECKNEARIDLAGYVTEAKTEASNAGARFFAAVVKRRGKSDAGEAYAVMPLRVLADLLSEALS